MWLASTCCTTVGYGNFVPTTDGAKIFLVFYSPIAIGCFAKMMGFIASQVLRAARWTLVHTCLKDPVQQVTVHQQACMILSGGKAIGSGRARARHDKSHSPARRHKEARPALEFAR